MKKVKLVFQGDSITDAGRDKRNYHNMGNGYPKYASALMSEAHPEIEFEFINQGIGGNRTDQLFDRVYPDAIAFEPDVVSSSDADVTASDFAVVSSFCTPLVKRPSMVLLSTILDKSHDIKATTSARSAQTATILFIIKEILLQFILRGIVQRLCPA